MEVIIGFALVIGRVRHLAAALENWLREARPLGRG
jgi:hypothetical protein